VWKAEQASGDGASRCGYCVDTVSEVIDCHCHWGVDCRSAGGVGRCLVLCAEHSCQAM
jgi:hypothetical protein